MAGYCTHLLVGAKVAQSLRVPGSVDGEFLFGCLAPDARSAHTFMTMDQVAVLWDRAHEWHCGWARLRKTIPFGEKRFSALNYQEHETAASVMLNLESVALVMIPSIGFLRRAFSEMVDAERAFVLGYVCHLATDEAWWEIIFDVLQPEWSEWAKTRHLARATSIALDLAMARENRAHISRGIDRVSSSQDVDVLALVDGASLSDFKRAVSDFVKAGLSLIDNDSRSLYDLWPWFLGQVVPEMSIDPDDQKTVLSLLSTLADKRFVKIAWQNSLDRVREFLELSGCFRWACC